MYGLMVALGMDKIVFHACEYGFCNGSVDNGNA